MVFLDGDMQFDPSSIKTQFTHVFILVKEEKTTSADGTTTTGFRVAITASTDVPKFGPPLPNPPVFTDTQRLHQFLMAKRNIFLNLVVNGENAAMKAPKFSKPHERTFLALFDDISEEFGQNETSRKSSKKSTNAEESTSPIRKIFGGHMSFNNRTQARKTFDGSMNDLNRPSIVANDSQSPKFLKDGIGAKGSSASGNSLEKLNGGRASTAPARTGSPQPLAVVPPSPISQQKLGIPTPLSPSPAAQSKTGFRPSLATVPAKVPHSSHENIAPSVIHNQSESSAL